MEIFTEGNVSFYFKVNIYFIVLGPIINDIKMAFKNVLIHLKII